MARPCLSRLCSDSGQLAETCGPVSQVVSSYFPCQANDMDDSIIVVLENFYYMVYQLGTVKCISSQQCFMLLTYYSVTLYYYISNSPDRVDNWALSKSTLVILSVFMEIKLKIIISIMKYTRYLRLVDSDYSFILQISKRGHSCNYSL